MSEPIEFLTPVGRLVQGNPFKPNTTDMYGNPLTVKYGANAGQPRVDYYIGLAIPKNDPGLPELWSKLTAAAQQGFPGGQFNNPGFSWKVIDGDGLDSQGQPYSNREGFAGHWILKMNSGYAPTCYSAGGASKLVEEDSIKKGYYIRAYGNTQGNGNMQNPGVYVNLSMIELIGYGPEIISGPDGATIFGGTPAALPPGASSTPLAPQGSIAGPGAPQGQPQAGPGGYPPPAGPGAPQGQPQAGPGGYPPPAGPGAPVQPYTPQIPR